MNGALDTKNQNYVDDFLRLYTEVIDDNGHTKVCGREKCKELIRLAHMITGGLNTYGNPVNGMIYTNKMIELYTLLKK